MKQLTPDEMSQLDEFEIDWCKQQSLHTSASYFDLLQYFKVARFNKKLTKLQASQLIECAIKLTYSNPKLYKSFVVAVTQLLSMVIVK